MSLAEKLKQRAADPSHDYSGMDEFLNEINAGNEHDEEVKEQAKKLPTPFLDEQVLAYICECVELPDGFVEAILADPSRSPFPTGRVFDIAWKSIAENIHLTGLAPSREVLWGHVAKCFYAEDTDAVEFLDRLKGYKLDVRDAPILQAELAEWTKERTREEQRRQRGELIGAAVDKINAAALRGDDEGIAALAIVQELREALAAKPASREQYTFGELAAAFPTLHPVVVDNLLREGEIANLISHSKVGKSWLVYSLALSVVTGRPWLDTFPTTAGKVLIIDNELHKPTLASRIQRVADALGIRFEDYKDNLEVWSLRAHPRSMSQLRGRIEAMTPGEFTLIIMDAKYRFTEQDGDENDNSGETRVYNLLNEYADKTRAAIVLVHHATKGSQSDKRVTDVGSGAGAQSRAADTHLVLREHEEDATVVAEAVVRSFPPVAPLVLRWEFPLWRPVADVDPTKLATAGSRQQKIRDDAGSQTILEALGKLTVSEWISSNQLAILVEMGHTRVDKLCHALRDQVEVRATKSNGKGLAYRLRPPSAADAPAE